MACEDGPGGLTECSKNGPVLNSNMRCNEIVHKSLTTTGPGSFAARLAFSSACCGVISVPMRCDKFSKRGRRWDWYVDVPRSCADPQRYGRKQ